MKMRLHKLLYYTLLLGVYGIFFSVESFYNFEGHSNASDIIRYASLTGGHEKDASVARTSPLHSASTHSIRLNKRFHQEDMPPCPVMTPALPEYVLMPPVLGYRCSTDLPEPALLHRPLRGPPALA
ncbi:MAG TPA: hypothetical protein VGS79_21845 [Puia sp.]|nr:hypothetical protein [Puia sp.]